jgi:tetratricopeptide (TPR) repeat protein
MMPSLAKLKKAEDVQLASAEVSSMMEYLETVKGQTIFSVLLKDLGSGVKFEHTFIKHAGQDLIEFQNSWENWAKKLELKNIPGIEVLTTEFKNRKGLEPENKDYKHLQSKKAQNFTFLGDILKSRDHFKAAIIEYKKAMDQSSTHSPVLFNKLAGTYLQTQKYQEAETLLKKSLAFFPDFHTTLVNLGELYYSNQENETAQIYFERALRINPFNPFAHIRLIHVYEKLGLNQEKQLQARQFKYID